MMKIGFVESFVLDDSIYFKQTKPRLPTLEALGKGFCNEEVHSSHIAEAWRGEF